MLTFSMIKIVLFQTFKVISLSVYADLFIVVPVNSVVLSDIIDCYYTLLLIEVKIYI